jgi:hypothetical protein
VLECTGSGCGQRSGSAVLCESQEEVDEAARQLFEALNAIPVLAEIPDMTVGAGTEIAFSINAIDRDGDALSYVAGVLPEGATFNSATGDFAWVTYVIGEYEQRAG